MENETVKIPRKEYEQLLAFKKVDQDLLADIAMGTKDILQDKIKEV